MKNAKKVAFCSMMTALAVMIMLSSYFPYITYSVPCFAGLMTMVVAFELSKRWAYGVYAASSVLIFLFAEPEAKLLYIAFFGYYPVLKLSLEAVGSRVVQFVLKFVVFNAAVVLAYTIFSAALGVDMSDMGDFGRYTSVILLIFGNVVFVIYDILIDRVAGFYAARLHRTVDNFLQK